MTKITKIEVNIDQQQYTQKDVELINSIKLQRKFGLPEDYIELHTLDLNNNLLKSNYNYIGYKSLVASLPNSNNLIGDLTVSPEQDAINEGYNYGAVKLTYNIFRNLFGSNSQNKFFIKTISTDRTELRVSSNNTSNSALQDLYNAFLLSFNSESYYKDYYLNFGTDQLLIGVNVILEQDPSQYNLLIKLYEPLPSNLDLKDQFWFIDKLSDPISYQVDFEIELQTIAQETFKLKGPNFNIKINEEINPSIDFVNYNSFFSTTSTSSYQQIKSLLEEKSLDINVNYSEYENFVHFSSAKERLLNFIYKLQLIENYNSDLNTLYNTNNTTQVSASKAILEDNINNIIEKFDGYEYYLYYESGSKAWPKKSNTKPYSNYEITSSIAINWLGSDNDNELTYGGQLYSASYYDTQNQDNIYYTIPEYLRIDDKNKGYEVFLHMIGQHFDNIWLYSKGITDVYDASNNLNEGISKDLVAYALRSLGIKLYSNTNVSNNIFSYLIGATQSGSYQYPTGSEFITTLVTASNTTLSGAEIDKEVYKRIYHNLPYLLKSKGTERGLRALISCYGIPDTILRINEFGGVDKDSRNFEQYINRLSYALNTKTGSIYVTTPWSPSYQQSLSSSVGSGSIVPDTVEFRFKTNGIPNSTYYSQSIYQVNSGSNTQFGVQLLYPSQSSTGSYNKYGTLRLMLSGTQGYNFSAPISLPFFNNDWWNVMVYRETGSLVSSSINNSNKYWIYVANSIYNGNDGETIGYIGSSSIFISSSISSSYNKAWNSYDLNVFNAYLGGESSNNILAPNDIRFNGFFQELRYWINNPSVDNFIGHTLNPLSIESNNETGSYNKLIYRLPLGTDLNIDAAPTVNSIHPSITANTGSFMMNSGIVSYGNIIDVFGASLYGVAVYGVDVYLGESNNIVYTGNTEFYYLKTGNMGLGSPVNDKIRIVNQDIASGNVLSPFTKIEQYPEQPLTNDTRNIEVAFSPQDQINNDIISQLGYFDIDNLIGDPREARSVKYEDLKNLREFYFKKYINSYNLFDFIRLIKYYNNSLFKMMKDFVPGRSNTSTGIVLKPHFLERSKIERHEPSISNLGQSGSIDIVEVSSTDGGSINPNASTTYTQYIASLLGPVSQINNKRWEPFTGEFSGSNIRVLTQSLQTQYGKNEFIDFYHSSKNILINNVSASRISNKYFDVDYSTNPTIATNLDLIRSQSNLAKALVQDSNYTLARHINSRYLGSKTLSQQYNNYTEGDKSYGKTSAIDHQARKLGLFTNVSRSLFFSNKSETSIKYLVDEFGNLTELNQQNKNWFETQHTFKSGESLTVALLDPLKFGNQKSLNGEKTIYNSGYSYNPVLYFSSSDTTLVFDENISLTKGFEVINNDYYDLSSASPTSSLYRGITYDFGSNWITSNSPITQYYKSPAAGQYAFNSTLQLSASSFIDVIGYNIVTLGSLIFYSAEFMSDLDGWTSGTEQITSSAVQTLFGWQNRTGSTEWTVGGAHPQTSINANNSSDIIVGNFPTFPSLIYNVSWSIDIFGGDSGSLNFYLMDNTYSILDSSSTPYTSTGTKTGVVSLSPISSNGTYFAISSVNKHNVNSSTYIINSVSMSGGTGASDFPLNSWIWDSGFGGSAKNTTSYNGYGVKSFLFTSGALVLPASESNIIISYAATPNNSNIALRLTLRDSINTNLYSTIFANTVSSTPSTSSITITGSNVWTSASKFEISAESTHFTASDAFYITQFKVIY